MSKLHISVKDFVGNDELDRQKINTKTIKELFKDSDDVIYQNVVINKNVHVSLLYVSGLVNLNDVGDLIIKPLTSNTMFQLVKNDGDFVKCAENGFIYFPSVKKVDKLSELTNDLLMGSTAIVIDSLNVALLLETKGFDKRGVDIPSEEKSLKGAKDSFVETINSNTAILRRRIRTPSLVIKNYNIGRVSNTTVAMIYLKGIAQDSLIKSIENKLKSIDVDHVLYTNIIEEKLIENKDTAFPLVHYTEKPDFFCQSLFQGRIGIIIDGIPFALIFPTSIFHFFQSTDDYSQNYITSSIIRFFRYVFAIVAIILPAFYVAITGVHFEMIPESLALEILSAEQGIPFPIFLETIILMVAFQALVEAGIRIWSSVGGMVAVVGALIVGEAAVNAHYVSPGVVVIVAISMISLFTVSNNDLKNALWIWSIILIMFSTVLGLFSLSVGIIILIFHLAKIEENGIPYLSPFVSHDNQYFEDTIFRSINSFEKQQKQVKK